MSRSPAIRAEIQFLRSVLVEMEQKPPYLMQTNGEFWKYAGLSVLAAIGTVLLLSSFGHKAWFRMLAPVFLWFLGAFMVYMPGRTMWRTGISFLRPFLNREGIEERLRELEG